MGARFTLLLTLPLAMAGCRRKATDRLTVRGRYPVGLRVQPQGCA